MLGKHVHEIERLPAHEFNRWVAYFKVEPIPDVYMAAAVVAHTTAAVNRAEGSRMPDFEDFLVKTPPPPETDEERVARLARQWGVKPNG